MVVNEKMKYTLYAKDTGEIVSIADAEADTIDSTAGSNGYITGEVIDPMVYVIKNGKPVKKTGNDLLIGSSILREKVMKLAAALRRDQEIPLDEGS